MSTAGIDSKGPRRDVIHGVRNYVYTDWNKSNFLEVVKTECSEFKKFGFEADHMNVKLFNDMKSYCFGEKEEPSPKKARAESNGNGHAVDSAVAFVDVSQKLMAQRLVKSPEEIKLIRKACEIANAGCDRTIEALAENKMEWKIAEAGVQRMNELISDAFPTTEMRDTWIWFQSGVNTDGAHNALTSKPLKKNDLLSFNMFPMIDGYYVALERTGFFGDGITQEHLRYWKINVEVFEKGREMLIPGAKVGDVAKELNKIYAREGVLDYRTFGYGHSFGVLCHYYGRETILEIREDNETILQPGMVVSMEPHITVPEGLEGAGGYREHDILLITEKGNENLTNYKYGPDHMIFKPNTC